MKSWKDAHLEAIGINEAKYTNVHNKIKGIRNLSRKDADMIANIDPAVLGPVIKALSPMFEEVKEGLQEARIPMYKPTKFEGKEFDRKKEINSLKKMQKAIHKVAKMQDDMQYTAETGGSSTRGNPHGIYQSLVNAEQEIFNYMGGIERGYYDGIIDMDRD